MSQQDGFPVQNKAVQWLKGWGKNQFGGKRAQEQGASLMTVYAGDGQTFNFAAANQMLNIPFAAFINIAPQGVFPQPLNPKP